MRVKEQLLVEIEKRMYQVEQYERQQIVMKERKKDDWRNKKMDMNCELRRNQLQVHKENMTH